MTSDIITSNSVLQVTVKNHAGVLSHICGLFARRAYSIEGIISVPQGDTSIMQVYLLVQENGKLDQVMRQTQKLVDVISVKRRDQDVSLFQSVSAQLADSVATL